MSAEILIINLGCLRLFIEAKESAIAKYNDRQDLGPYKSDELNYYLQSHIDSLESSIKEIQESFVSINRKLIHIYLSP